MTAKATTSIALALGAGGARGLAHIHALKAFDDLGVKPGIIAGTSIGAIMGAAFACGMTGQEIEDYVLDRFQNRRRLLSDALKIRPDSIASYLEDGGMRIGELNLERILDVFLPQDIPDSFEALGIPLKVIATDYYEQDDRMFEQGPLRPALAASAAMPAIFLPVEIDDRYHIDGGTTNPVPFDRLQGTADVIVGIDVSGGTFGAPDKRPRKTDVLYAASQLMQKSIVNAKSRSCQVDILLRPAVERFRVLDFLKTKTVLDQTQGLREELKAALDQALSQRVQG